MSKNITYYLALFIVFDIFYSNFLYKDELKYNCYKYYDNFHDLKKNCKAKEKWIRNSKAYDVFTDNNGFRFSGEIRDDKNKTAKLVRVPKFAEVPFPVIMEPSLVIEYYSR